MLHLTNPWTKRMVLILSKPKGNIYKTKSLRNYITEKHDIKYTDRTREAISTDDVTLLGARNSHQVNDWCDIVSVIKKYWKTFDCVQKIMNPGSFKNVINKMCFKNHIYFIDMYKQVLALNNLQWLICHKTKPNQTKSFIFSIYL